MGAERYSCIFCATPTYKRGRAQSSSCILYFQANLLVSYFNMNFDREIASELGVNCAILLSNIYFWVEMNEASKSELHYKEGYYWTFNAISAFEKVFDFMTKSQIRTALDKLEECGYLVSGRFNKFGADRTKWYRPSEKALKVLCDKSQISVRKIANQCAENHKPFVKNHTPIPDITTDKKTDINPDSLSPAKAVDTNPPNKLSKEEMDIIFKFRGLFCPAEDLPKLYAMEKRSGSARKLLSVYSSEEIIKVMDRAKELAGQPYKPQVSSWPSLVSKFELVRATLPKEKVATQKILTNDAELNSFL